MSRWGNSAELTTTTYQLVEEHPGMARWAVRAAVHGALYGGGGVLIGSGLAALGGGMSSGPDGGAAGIAVLILGLVVAVLGLVAGMTAANRQLAGLVSVTDDVLHGREPDESAARAAAHTRLGALAAWSAISIAVGAVVSMIRGDGQGGLASSILRSLLAGAVASVWAVAATLVLPVIVLERLGAVSAVRRSAGIIRTTWGEAVLGSVRIGARFALRFMLPGVVSVAAGIALAVVLGGPAIGLGVLLVLAGAVLIVVGAVKAATCRTVFGVALYRWASGEGALGPYREDDLRSAVRTRGVGTSAAA